MRLNCVVRSAVAGRVGSGQRLGGSNEHWGSSAEKGKVACGGGLDARPRNCGWLHRVRLEHLGVAQLSLPLRQTELLAVALSVERMHGAAGPRVIAAKIGALHVAGEAKSTAFWREVARVYEQHLIRTSDGTNGGH